MDRSVFNIGEWRVDVAAAQIARGDEVVRVDARLMRLLTCLAARDGEVVTTDELLEEVWSGLVVTQDSVYQGVAALRRLLGDDSRRPAYIATVPRRGYRLVAAVNRPVHADPLAAPTAPAPPAQTSAVAPTPGLPAQKSAVAPTPGASAQTSAMAPTPGPSAQTSAVAPTPGLPAQTSAVGGKGARRKVVGLLAVGAVLCLAQAASVDPGAAAPRQSVAVLPFLDLTTESMDQEFFADGLTEELIDDLSRVPGLEVPSPTASFYFKGKQMPLANIARELGVAYVVDGSLRKADSTLRVAARLVRADTGYVIWSGTYDRQSDNVLKVQADVAAEVTEALRSTLQALPTH